ncbi:hypothetical protein DFS33DRAFT_1387746 [Desarmillaria ectypa]|nr:hypothetical protein DFS33DRAFT_1387746 [Desarmillaria ectypa]
MDSFDLELSFPALEQPQQQLDLDFLAVPVDGERDDAGNVYAIIGRACINYLFAFSKHILPERQIQLSLLLRQIALYPLELSHFDSVRVVDLISCDTPPPPSW